MSSKEKYQAAYYIGRAVGADAAITDKDAYIESKTKDCVPEAKAAFVEGVHATRKDK